MLDKTKGLISCAVGSYKMSLSTSDALVSFNERTKRFEESNYADAITTFVSAPENWYVVLKNPTQDGSHPTPGTANSLPPLQIGKKINIRGNVSFALYPGQMAKVIQGHSLHSNQYLLARVYDADALNKGLEDEESAAKYVNGQMLVIKGTDVPFYIPPTGIEVIPVGGHGSQYVRDAVTLERLEYCILKDEQGNKKYIHGAAVVFPEPDEVFIQNDDGGYKFKAIELSDISGIYVKVIADYKDGGVSHKAGEELFITGKDTMIYYPRPEHAIIDYEGNIVNHAIAIPAGEGRYVMDRKTGIIKTVKGPAMYLPDPREEVVVRRVLTPHQCDLWFPGNSAVKQYNAEQGGIAGSPGTSFAAEASAACRASAMAPRGFSRGNTYKEPRTITLDNKLKGVVAIDVWTGYAVNVVSKSGTRKVIVGPQTYLLDYDETLEALQLSTGKPKTTDILEETVYLRAENNKISDIITVQTKDFVNVDVKVSYCVDFLPEYKDKWFNVENYVKYMCDRQKSLLKQEAKKHSIEDFYGNAYEIIRKVALDAGSDQKCGRAGRFFGENGMLVHDVEVLSVKADAEVQEMINQHQIGMVAKSLELSNSSKEVEIARQLAEADKEKAAIQYDSKTYALGRRAQFDQDSFRKDEELRRMREEAEKAEKTAREALQPLLDAIQDSELARDKKESDAEVAGRKAMDDLKIAMEAAHAKAVKSVIESISPDLIAAMTSSANAEMLRAAVEAMSPYAIADGESVADVTNKLLRGTSLEGIIGSITQPHAEAEA